MNKYVLFLCMIIYAFTGCNKEEEFDLNEIDAMVSDSKKSILEKTTSKPGGKTYKTGTIGGTFVRTLLDDPKSFNLIATDDSSAKDILDPLYEYLATFDANERKFKPNLADFEIKADEKNKTMILKYTLRDDLYWTTFDGKVKVKVTSDDVVFWYDKISGNEALQSSAYAGQFVTMPDGTEERITIHKISETEFEFRFPRIDSNPVLSTNMIFGPKFIYEKALNEGGIDGVMNIFSVDTDVKTIPSLGQRHMIEYTPGVRIVMKRNPYYFKKDADGNSLPYTETVIYKIIYDMNTESLLFKNGEIDFTPVRHTDLDGFLAIEKPDFTIYNGGTTLGSEFFSFNQNPEKVSKKVNSWFTKTEFRQAMSCIVNRERIIRQVYKGLAEPAEHFFAKANIVFDPSIKQKYLYNPDKALKLLESVGFEKRSDGILVDSEGNPVEFEMITNANNTMRMDIISIFADEASKIGIKVTIKGMDFQKIVEMLTTTYDWESLILSLGTNYWPTSGSNVWISNGRLHLWRPFQEKPVTEWEARVDYLYNEGSGTADLKKAKKYWDEYQRILLDQCPVIYIAHTYSFMGIRNKWDNVFYDTLNGMKDEYLFLNE